MVMMIIKRPPTSNPIEKKQAVTAGPCKNQTIPSELNRGDETWESGYGPRETLRGVEISNKEEDPDRHTHPQAQAERGKSKIDGFKPRVESRLRRPNKPPKPVDLDPNRQPGGPRKGVLYTLAAQPVSPF